MSTTQQVPASVNVTVNGTVINAPGKPGNKPGYFWYEAALQGEIEDGKTIETALLGATAEFDGKAIPPAKKNRDGQGNLVVRLSDPRKYKRNDKAVLAGRATAGANVPGTGGNQTVSFWDVIEGGALDGNTVRVTLTGIEPNIVTISVAVQPKPVLPVRQRRVVGSASGPVKF